jgi:next-to-BRCA1 protein 1
MMSACGQEGVTPATATAYFAPQPVTRVPPAPPSVVIQSTERCDDDARFVEDLTIPDGTAVAPGELLEKRWAVENTGSCDWRAGYLLVRVDSSPMLGPSELALFPAPAGEPAIWAIEIEAPQESGEYIAAWQARSPSGEFFGDRVFVQIEVQP